MAEISLYGMTRNRVSYAWAGRTLEKSRRRPEPVIVAKMWDDLCIGVICQTNPEIAGSLRNIFRYSGKLIVFLGVEH